MYNVTSVLEALGDLDPMWVAKLLSLFLLPLADEDIAIAFGSYFVVNKSMSIGLVAITVYCGMVISDFAVYGIGAAARYVKWLDRLAVSKRVRIFSNTLSRNQFELVAICRVVPGLELIAFVACGWMRVPFGKFMVASIVVSALYLPLMLYLVIALGDGLDSHVGVWAWPVVVVFLAVVAFVRHRIFTLRERAPTTGGPSALLRPIAGDRFYEASRLAFRDSHPRLSRVRAVAGRGGVRPP